ncbi:MAG: CHASE2 domain-containing protein [Cyanobacteria bacterium P01_D01_bin.44]
MLGQVLAGRYKLIRVLGAGGFGQTYIAIDTQRPGEPQCVVKQLKPASQDATFLKVARRLFDTEVHTLKRLGEHSCIPRLLDSFEDNQEFYLVQELIDGEPLRDEIKRVGRYDEAKTIELLREALAILKFVHEHHVLHRDIKPDNFIRRRSDGKLVMIDFGAVKEIRTQIVSGEMTNLTVGIGTQGYTPSEQLAGKPRHSSDVFALGMTAIHALTGRVPTDIPELEGSLDLRWQDFAPVSPGLAILINKMVRHYFYQRYQSVDEVLRDLDRLDELPKEVPLTAFPETYLPLQTVWQPTWKESLRAVAIATLTAAGLTLGLRQMGAFVPAELLTHDWLMSHSGDPGPDPRLLLVGITEQDLNNLQTEIPSDQAIADAIENLQAHQPITIGLDLHRNIPQGAGREALGQSLQAENIIGITKLGDDDGNIIPPPPELDPAQVGFNDFPTDFDNKVRRNLFFANSDNYADGEVIPSFALQVAADYLYQQHGLEVAPSTTDPDIIVVGDTLFNPITATFGGYQSVDALGYQIFLTYRSPDTVARQVSLSDVLNNAFDPSWVTDKIILIGTTAYTSPDQHFTPYSLLGGHNHQMPGVEVHGHMVSQFLTAVLDNQSLPWAWPDWLEISWICLCAGAGGALTWLIRRPSRFGLAGLGGGTAITGVGMGFFLLNAWVPIAAPLAAFVLSGGSLLAYRRYRLRQLNQGITKVF